MKITMKTLLASALTIACATGVYAAGGGGGAGAGGNGGGAGGGTSATGGNGTGTGGAGGYEATPGGNTLKQPQNRGNNAGGYGSPGTTTGGMGTRDDSSGMGANGNMNVQPGQNNPSDNPQNKPLYQQRQ